jgi:pyruvate dehydrogenase E1 component beta subunit
MYAALQCGGPVVFLEHKLLSEYHLDYLGSGGRKTVQYDIPEVGKRGPVPSKWEPVPFGKSVHRRHGTDITIASIGVSVHRAIQAADILSTDGISASVIDLRSVVPLDVNTLCEDVSVTGRLLVVDEDYESFGLSGELAAVVSETTIPYKYARVCTQTTIPYARHMEDAVLPNVDRILMAAKKIMG